MKSSVPILLSFYGLSNGTKNLFFGKLAYSSTSDLSFQKYNWFKNFRTVLALYDTEAIALEEFVMTFDHGEVKGKTDVSGSFWCEAELHEQQTKLVSITITKSGRNVKLTEELYPNSINHIETHTIVISDLDDTLIHSFVRNKWRQLKTLLFTSVEKRKAVEDMLKLIRRLALSGASPFYLSNSEQNLYPMLYRFLLLNEFPAGPLFLKQYTRFQHLLIKRILGKKNPHKFNTLQRIIELFPNKKYILIGDNTQHDLNVYLTMAEKHVDKIRYIIIRKVYHREEDLLLIEDARKRLSLHKIGIHYADTFPDDLPFDF